MRRAKVAVARKLDRAKRCCTRIILGIDDREPRNVESRFAGEVADARFRTDERRGQVAGKFA